MDDIECALDRLRRSLEALAEVRVRLGEALAAAVSDGATAYDAVAAELERGPRTAQ